MSKTETLMLITLTWVIAAYVIAPKLWAMYFRKHPYFAHPIAAARPATAIPAIPSISCLPATRAELQRAMTACGWVPAKPITLASSVQIAADTVLHRPTTRRR